MESKRIEMKKGQRCKFCTCGASKTIPFCDDSHRDLNEKTGSNYKSLKITPEADVAVDVFSKTWVKDEE